MEKSKVNYDNFLADFNLYLCESFGCRDAASIGNEHNDGCTVFASDRRFHIYFRLWEKCNRQLPNMSVVIVHTTFRNPKCHCAKCDGCKEYQRTHFEGLLAFLKSYAPIYGFQNMVIEAGPIDYVSDKTEYGFTTECLPHEYPWQIVSFNALMLPKPNEE